MKIKIIVSLLFIFLFFTMTVQAGFVFHQSIYDVDLIAGDTVSFNITFKLETSGSSNVPLEMSTSILPDSEGITVSYLNVPLTIIPNKEYTIQMVIDTDIFLAPENYTIKTLFHSNQSVSSPTVSHGKYIQHPESEEQPPKEENNTEPENNNDQNDTIIPDDENQNNESGLIRFWWILLISGIIIFSLLIFFLLRKRKSDKK